jgi:hypothetical protein
MRVSGDDPDGGIRPAIAALRGVLARLEAAEDRPWHAAAPLRSVFDGRLSATDQLSWWFRPANGGDDPWDSYFADDMDGADYPFEASLSPDAWHNPWDRDQRNHAPDRGRPLQTVSEPPSPRDSLKSLLLEPEPDLPDDDAECVVTCLYDFVHAVGRDDLDGAMSCVATDYHAIEDDHEVDRDGLAQRLKALLDSLHGWDKDTFLVEIPQPVLHPVAILVHVEMQINAVNHATRERRTLHHRRVAIFERQRDRSWRIAALSPI